MYVGMLINTCIYIYAHTHIKNPGGFPCQMYTLQYWASPCPRFFICATQTSLGLHSDIPYSHYPQTHRACLSPLEAVQHRNLCLAEFSP